MIIGLNGCYCHPFKNWDECKKYHTQKFKFEDKVKHRCYSKEGVISRVEKDGFVIVKYGPLQSDIELTHVPELIKL